MKYVSKQSIRYSSLLWSMLLAGVFVLATVSLAIGSIGKQQETKSVSSSSLAQLEAIPMTPGVPLTTARIISFVGVTAFVGGPTISGKPPTILLCKEMTGKQAEKYYYQEDLPDGPVIYVRLYGPFIIPHLFAHNPHMKPVQEVEEVFDMNGRVIDWGVLE